MKVLVIDGPNINMLGIREPAIYGSQNYAALCALIESAGRELGFIPICRVGFSAPRAS